MTIDPHPHLGIKHASVHPCKHAAVMKIIVANLVEGCSGGKAGAPPSIDQYLFIFLKFIQSVVPTIDYDFTTEVEASTHR